MARPACADRPSRSNVEVSAAFGRSAPGARYALSHPPAPRPADDRSKSMSKDKGRREVKKPKKAKTATEASKVNAPPLMTNKPKQD